MLTTILYLMSIYFLTIKSQNHFNISDDPYYTHNIEALRENYDENRESLIYKLCTHRSRFTAKELETARVYLQTRYINGASVKPQSSPCKSLQVIRDFKCLSHEERLNVTEGFKRLYANGVIDRISYYHGGYWPFVHLLAEGFPYHNMFLNDLQQQIEKINPTVIIPYWDTTLDFAAPEKSIIWEYFGHSGNESNDYVIPDGPFRDQKVKYPTEHFIKRQWNTDGTIPAWESPEVLTFGIQQATETMNKFGPIFFSQHFKKHLNIGGLNGDIAIPYATNEPLFHLYHIFELYFHYFKWQLESDVSLVPLSLNNGGKHVPPYDWNGGEIVTADIENDRTLYYNTTIAEALTFGFGQLCYIPDQIIEQINNVVNMRSVKLPAAIDRLRNVLPKELFAKYFPKFATNLFSELNYMLPDVGSSVHSNHTCSPLPIPPNFNSTEIGKRQFERFNQIGRDQRTAALMGEQQINEFITTLNKYNYCSPYA